MPFSFLEVVARPTKLEYIILRGTKVNDEGLGQLRRLVHLRTLDLVASTDITPEGIPRLQQALPDRKIVY